MDIFQQNDKKIPWASRIKSGILWRYKTGKIISIFAWDKEIVLLNTDGELGRHNYSSQWKVKSKMKVAQSCLTLWDPMVYTVHGILQARILEWVAFPFFRGSSQPRDQTQVSCIAGGFFTSWATMEAQSREYSWTIVNQPDKLNTTSSLLYHL